MEEFLAPALDQRGALVRQIHDALEVEPGGVVVCQRREVGVLGLADDELGARVVEEHVVHDAAPPHHDAVLAAEANVADERVAAAVPVVGVVVRAQMVLLVLSAALRLIAETLRWNIWELRLTFAQ